MKRFLFLSLAVFFLVSGVYAGGRQQSGASEGPVELSMFIDYPAWAYRAFDGEMPKWFTEQTNVTYDVSVASNYTELPLMVAADSYPDIVISPNFNLMSNAAISYTWQELIDKHNIDWAIHPAYEFVNRAADGKMYTIQVGYSADYEYEKYNVWPEGPGIALRNDILEAGLKANGLTEIKTIEDLELIFETCKQQFPGVQPYISNQYGPQRWFSGLYGFVEEGFTEQDGKSVVFIYDRNWKPGLMKLNEWYRKGYILEETLSWTTGSIAQEWMAQGRTFAMGGLSQAGIQGNKASILAGTPYRWSSLKTISTPTSAVKTSTVGWRGHFITKNCSDTEAAIRATKFHYSKEEGGYDMLWGMRGRDWNWNAEKNEAVFNYDIGNEEFTEKQLQVRWGWIGHDGISNLMRNMNDPVNRDGLEWVNGIIVRLPVQGIIMNQMDSESAEYVIYNNILELKRTQLAKIILASSAQEAEAAYNEMIRLADQLGGQRLNDWANAKYPALRDAYERVRGIGPEGWIKK